MTETARQRRVIADRIEATGNSVDRFIDVLDGEKGSPVDHSDPANRYGPDGVSGNYGVYVTTEDSLLWIDIDDYDDIDDPSGLTATHRLPNTFEQRSPHGGTHHLYNISVPGDRSLAEAMREEFDVANPGPTYGEIRAANQYVVGAGSQLDGCDKDGCTDCATEHGGRYEISNDREVATVDFDKLVDVIYADPNYERGPAIDEEEAPDPVDRGGDVDEILEYALEADDKLNHLWNGRYSAAGYDDRSAAECALAMKLAFWVGSNKKRVARLLNRADTKKWAERTDESYRDSVLEAVEEQNEQYEPSEHGYRDPSDFDPTEVGRGLDLLRTQNGPESPSGGLDHKNGCYGMWLEYEDENGEYQQTFKTVCNFTLETLSYLETYEGELLNIRVHPHHPHEEAYDVQVSPTVFNEARDFREEIVRGRTTSFEPSAVGATTETILNNLRKTVGSQPAPKRTGSEFIGLHGEDHDEWLNPHGSIGSDGWIDDPEYVYYPKGGGGDETGALAEKWELDPADGNDYDTDEVARICELLPNVRDPERGLPVLGWFYAAPLKPIIHEIEGEFNLLQVYGNSGSGKTSAIQAFWEAFGVDPTPFSASDTGFTVEKHMAESCGLPVWYDEYKPTDIDDYRLDRLRRRLREVTRERSIPKGTATLGEVMFKLRAPVLISGEQQVEEAAVRRRTIMTNLRESATDAGTETVQAFGELTGTPYEDPDGHERFPDGYDVSEHALAYYRHVLGLSTEEIEQAWFDARERTTDILSAHGFSHIDDTQLQGCQTVVFGVAVFKQFATAMGADEDALPTAGDVSAAVEHVASNVGPRGRRREHDDEFLELLTQAANAGYLEEGAHHRVVDSQNHGEFLAVHMPSTFGAVKKYVREFNLEGEYTVLGKNDYLDSFRNKAEVDGTYILETSKRVRGLDNGARAVAIDPEAASDRLGDDFSLGAFTAAQTDADGVEDGEPDITPLSAATPGYCTLTVLVEASEQPDDAPMHWTGTVRDTTKRVDGIAWTDADVIEDLEAGQCYRIDGAKIGHDHDGAKQIEIVAGVTTAEAIQYGVGYAPKDITEDQQTDLATADGGEISGLRGRVLTLLQDANNPKTVGTIAGELDENPETIQERIDTLSTRGEIRLESEGWKINT